ncbi:MAG: response regulator [Lachnospiraceae bacterium]|nr:response regulator [Lachnospiraceae bacterium]
MDKQNILIISNSQSYLVKSISDKLAAIGYNVIVSKLNVTDLSKIKDEIHAVFIYAEDDIRDSSQALVFIKDRALEEDAAIFATGGPEEQAEIYNNIPKHMIVNYFTRPINVAEVSNTIDTHIQEFGKQKKKKILVVDDSGAMLRNVKGWLEGKYHITLANSAASALKSISLQTPDLVLLDYEMPVVDGKQVLEMIRTEHEFEKLPVIFLTGKDDKESIMAVMALKPNGYLLKSRPPQEIVAAVDDFFEKQKALK